MAGLARLSGSADASSLDALRDPAASALKARAAGDPKAVIKAAAKQFEALFMQQLMKSMREATMSSGMLDNEGTKMGTEMLDTQFATKMTGMPVCASAAFMVAQAAHESGWGKREILNEDGSSSHLSLIHI